MSFIRRDGQPYFRAYHEEVFSRYAYLPVFAIINMVTYLQLASVVPIITCIRWKGGALLSMREQVHEHDNFAAGAGPVGGRGACRRRV